jgi:biopolymer transport protein ExbD
MIGRRSSEQVELNVAAMLDMAFQLLTFFILTFRPPPVEEGFVMNLPPPKPVQTNLVVEPWELSPVPSTEPVVRGVDSLTVSVFSRSGGIDRIRVGGEQIVEGLGDLHHKLSELFGARESPFEQVVLQVGRNLRYGETLQVLGVCMQQKLPTTGKQPKLSFIVMNDDLPK